MREYYTLQGKPEIKHTDYPPPPPIIIENTLVSVSVSFPEACFSGHACSVVRARGEGGLRRGGGRGDA